MKYVYIILQIVCLYMIFFIGEWIRMISHIPIPGSIIGMLLLFMALTLNVIKREWLSLGSSFLLKNLPLLFVPATVGIIDYLDLFKGFGFISLVISIVSTMLVFITSAIVSEKMLKRAKGHYHQKGIHL